MGHAPVVRRWVAVAVINQKSIVVDAVLQAQSAAAVSDSALSQ